MEVLKSDDTAETKPQGGVRWDVGGGGGERHVHTIAKRKKGGIKRTRTSKTEDVTHSTKRNVNRCTYHKRMLCITDSGTYEYET